MPIRTLTVYDHCRSARFQCAAICRANTNCVAYYYIGSECHEANGIGVIGAMPDSSTAMMAYIDSSLDPGKTELAKHSAYYYWVKPYPTAHSFN